MANSNPAPGFQKNPDHSVVLRTDGATVVLRLGDDIVADTGNALTVTESGYPPRYYIPAGDVRMDLLEATDHRTYCPYKGDARYWTVRTPGHVLENGAWAYDDPYDETAGLKGHISFYAEKMDVRINGKQANGL